MTTGKSPVGTLKAFFPLFIGTCHVLGLCFSRYWDKVVNKAKENACHHGAWAPGSVTKDKDVNIYKI